MAGQFYLGDAIKFTFARPQALSTAGGGGPTSWTYDTTQANVMMKVFDPAGNVIVGDTLDNIVANAVPHVSFDTIGTTEGTLVCTAALPTSAGRWMAVSYSNALSGGNIQLDYCDVLPYYNPEALTQKFDPTTHAMLHKTGGIGGTTLQYQLAYDANGDPATTYAGITALGPIVVGVP